jgi:curved DNA-binding protein CbpA
MSRVHVEAATREKKRREKRAARQRGKQVATAGADVADDAPRAVRDIYRKLASALHPDREADPAARARKTTLMQRANHAYANADLVELLGLQLELEQIDHGDLTRAPEALLERYNHVLAEQSRTLEQAVREVREAISAALGVSDLVRDAAEVERVVDEQIGAARAALAAGENDLARLDDPSQLDALLRDFAAAEATSMSRRAAD